MRMKKVRLLIFFCFGIQILPAQKKIILEPELSLQPEIAKEDFRGFNDYAHLLSHSKKMKDILTIMNQVAETNITVLVRGESGTGKELVSRTIHAPFLKERKAFRQGFVRGVARGPAGK